LILDADRYVENFRHSCLAKAAFTASSQKITRVQGGFNGRPLVQWPTRPLGGWALELEAPGPPSGAPEG